MGSVIQKSCLFGTHAVVMECDLPWYEESLQKISVYGKSSLEVGMFSFDSVR
jgi:hypothetical protein